jgi:riboflavin kinase / FMN adenylyltransferase
MEYQYEYSTTLPDKQPIVITIGNFDGIHRGHQQLLHELQVMAHELACTPVIVTFSPHTLTVVRPEADLQCLTTLDEKLSLAAHYSGIPENIVIHFTSQVVALSAQSFMDELLARFSIRGLVVGEDFSLGRNRMGDIHFLRQYGAQHQILVRSTPLAADSQERISSTRIRALVREGAIKEANALLGHPLLMLGEVVHGDERGRLLGFPTANIRPPLHKLLPANGVYAVRAGVANSSINDPTSDGATESFVYTDTSIGVANIGFRPTFNGKERLLEVHLLDTHPDLYGSTLAVEFIDFLRSEQRFSGIDALKEQIAADVLKTRQIFSNTNANQSNQSNQIFSNQISNNRSVSN